MNTDKTSIYTTKQSKIIILVIIGFVSVFLFISSLYILTALLSTVILYILFKPLYLYLSDKKSINKSLSSISVISLSFLIIVLPLSGLSVMIINKLIGFQKHPEMLNDILNKIQGIIGSRIDLKDILSKSINDISRWSLSAFSVFISGAFKTFISLIVIYFSLFFMFKSHEQFEDTLEKYLPFDKKSSLLFGDELKKITYSNIIGQGFIGISQGIVVVVGFLIFGIPDPFFWGIISIFVCFLPIIGAPIIFVPAGIIELAMGNTGAGIGILIWGGVFVTLIDNCLRQYISKKIANIHPLITLLGVAIGVPVFGLIGLVIGPLMISFFLLLFKVYEASYMESANKE
jgi:predicted PurR-regulated permease PerM